ncbi:trypsin-like serine peptidase [Mesorhizobium neociceri]|uniref:Trypsin-like peptidase domain-containing protein n=1 Tax=Mesorhizobium neociceri TaxID=1307853 RepID=A0A838B0C8_9HYPH|nr:serine protease [Mesorhizobium neociceri]MBA1139447.1 trypsin-like peptidase domain-containing protein [Mesorhizobium neociceri]
MSNLSGTAIAELGKLIADTLSFDDLNEFVHASTGDRLFVEYVGLGKPRRATVIELLNALEELGTTKLFLRYVYVHRPGRDDVRQAIAKQCPAALAVPDHTIAISAQTAGQLLPKTPAEAMAPGLQRNVRPYLAKLDVRVWVERLLEIERRVCRIEYAGTAAGSGVLVGPDAVLTNWHVYEAVKAAGYLADLACRFDYTRLPDNSLQAGQLVAAHPDPIDCSHYSAAETTDTPENPLPTAQELDYALLRLKSAAGEQMLNGEKRGWIVLPAAAQPLPSDAPILIVQHPEGSPMKLALDTQAVIGRNGNGTRLRYRTNTDPGSSGSPCFNMDWDIVALHHYGDPKWANPLFNQGVPIELIRQLIATNGFSGALGD